MLKVLDRALITWISNWLIEEPKDFARLKLLNVTFILKTETKDGFTDFGNKAEVEDRFVTFCRIK